MGANLPQPTSWTELHDLRAVWQRDGKLTDLQMRDLMDAIDGVMEEHRVLIRAMMHLRKVAPGVRAALNDMAAQLPDRPRGRPRRQER